MRPTAVAGWRRGPPPAAAWIALGALLAAGVAIACNFTVDDAFITFRYAQHLAQGQGITWNPGQRVEGYTDFLWMLLLAAGAALGWPLTIVAKALGVAALAALLAMAAGVGRRRAGAWTRWWAAGALALTPATYYHAVSGLETTLYAVWVFGLYGGLGRSAEEPGVGLAVAVAALGLLAGLTRPEGVVPGAVGVIGAYLLAPPRSRRFRGALAAATAATVALGAAYFAWRWSYFGYALPNTAYVKVAHGTAGLAATWSFLLRYSPFVLLALAGFARARGPRRRLYGAGLALLASVTVPYVAFEPIMDFAGRYTYAALPVLFAISGMAVHDLAREGALAGAARRVLLAGALAVTLITAYRPPLRYGYQLWHAHIALGKALAAAPVPARWRSLAVGDAGAIPYYSGWWALDWLGLSDPAIAHGLDRTAAILAARPTLLLLRSDDGIHPATDEGLDNAAFARDYAVAGAVCFAPGYYLLALVRRDAPPGVRAALDAAVGRLETSSLAADYRPPVAASTLREMLRHL